MKILSVIIAVGLIVGLIGCSGPEVSEEPQVVDEPEPVVEEPVVNEPDPVVEEVELSCEEKAKELLPASISLTLADSHEPDSGYWEIVENSKWNDDSVIGTKGDIVFQKGRRTGENTNYWYTRNNRNEDLYGIGGLKYNKEVTTKDGLAVENKFLAKVVLNPLKINYDKEPFADYEGIFEVVESEIFDCNII